MPYDALGNYVPGDDEVAAPQAKPRGQVPYPQYLQIPTQDPLYSNSPNIDEMRRAIATMKSANFKDPLAKSRTRFADLQADIATLPQQVSDVANTLFGNPFQMAVRTPIKALLTGQTSTPEINALMDKNMAPMQTPQGAAFAENVGQAFEASKLPHAWPEVPRPTRPMLTGSDVRAMKGDVQRLATQMGEIPADFQAAQSGFQRIDPITGKPTMGAKLQTLADEWAGIMERRQSLADEVTPLQELTSPEMYAVRRKGTRLVEPTRPETAVGSRFSVDPATSIVRSVTGSRDLPAYNLASEWNDKVAGEFPNQLYDEMRRYANARISDMYPGMSTRDAMQAFNLEFGDKQANAAKMLELYTEFLDSDASAPGRAIAAEQGIPVVTPAEFAERHKLAVDWLQGPFSSYIIKNVGTEGDPLVALASQGLTYQTPTALRDTAQFTGNLASENRQMADMPEAGLVAPQLEAKSQQLATAQQELTAMEAQRQALLDQAEAQGVDPRTMPGYAESTNPIRAKARQVEQLNQEVENLKLGSAYETIADASIVPRKPFVVLDRDIGIHERPFYPSVTRAAPGEQLYVARQHELEDALGLRQIAKDAYSDIITGKIPADQLKNLTVEKYVRKGAEKRIAKEAEEAKAAEREKTVVTDAAKQQLDMAQIYLDNSSVIEATSAMSPEDIAKVLSMDTLVLDHCVGQCGQAPDNARNLFTGKHQSYRSIYDFNKNKVAKGDPLDYSYVRSVVEGGKTLASIRDKQTGLPVATIDLNTQGDGTYSIGYVSGYKNGEIEPAYSADIARYMNQYSDKISYVSENLADNAGVFDTMSRNNYRELVNNAARQLGVPVDVLRNTDPSGLPRFMTQKQFNEFISPEATMPSREVETRSVPNRAALEERYAELDRLVNLTQRFIDELENDGRTRGLSPEGQERLQAFHNNLEGYIDEQVAIDAELNPPQDWEPDPTHPANAPGVFDDLEQAEPRTYQQLLIDANSIVDTINGINERIANATDINEHTALTNARRVYHNTLQDLNREMEALQQQREQLPAPPAEVNVPVDRPATDLRNLADNDVAARLTRSDLREAEDVIAHIRDQLFNLEQDGVDQAGRAAYLAELQDSPDAYFGDIDPYVLEYAIRVAAGVWGAHGGIGPQRFAKGGQVKKKVQFAKTIPAMRAELLRRA